MVCGGPRDLSPTTTRCVCMLCGRPISIHLFSSTHCLGPINAQMTEYHLNIMAFPDLFRLFNTLEAPAEPLDGEYLAEILE